MTGDVPPCNLDTLPPRHPRPHVDNRGSGWARMVAGVKTPEESPSCTEQGCLVKAREARRATGRRQSRSARGQPRESNRDQSRATGVKRVILPAAISESAASRLLAEAGSREPPRRRRRGRSFRTERDDHREQNSAYSPTPSSYGAYSSIGRALVCGTGGDGFEPRKAPPQCQRGG